MRKFFKGPEISLGTHYIDWQWHIDNAAVSDLGTIVKNQIDLFKFHSVEFNTSIKEGDVIGAQLDLLFKYR